MNKKVMSALFIGMMINILFVGINIIDTGANRTSFSDIENESASLLTQEKSKTLDNTDEKFNCFTDEEKTKTNYDSIPVTRSPPDAPEPKGYEPVIYEPFSVQKVYPTADIAKSTSRSINKIYVLVDSSIYSSLGTYLTRYASDLENWTTYTAVIYQGSWGTPVDVRTFLQDGWKNNGTVGALLVGNIPAAWFEIANDYGVYGYASFPIDLFYADLDGNWVDAQTTPPMQAGVYDDHTGTVAPDIYVGRLKGSASLIQNYFNKNHAYRIGTLSLPHKALVYIDDDWIPWADEWSNNVGLVYSDRTLVKDGATTNAVNYKTRLTQDYEWIHLAAHSWADEHVFGPGGDGSQGSVPYTDIQSIDPHCFFYNLFCCSAARYTETNCIGNTYIFTNTYGLAVVGSTKTGSMLDLNYFYSPLQTKTIGESFKDWFTATGESDRSWFYGMTVLGDPTLSPTYTPVPFHDVGVFNLSVPKYLEVRKEIVISANISNIGQNDESNLIVQHTVNGEKVNETTVSFLGAGDTTKVNFTWKVNFRGEYQTGIQVKPVAEEDGSLLSNNYNNTTATAFDYFFYDDMELGINGWTHQNLTGTYDSWELGTPSLVPVPYSGKNCWATNLTESYKDLEDSVLVTKPLTLKGVSATLTFWHYGDWEDTATNWDGGIVELWDGSTWTQITPVDGYDAVLRSTNPLGEVEAFCYDTNTWIKEKFILDAYIDKTVQIRFHVGTDSSNNARGWFIDDFLLYGVVSPSPPVNVVAEVYEDNITLRWDASPTNGVDHYDIYVATTTDGFDFGTPDAQTNTNVWNHTNATKDGNNYFYIVRAVDKDGFSSMDSNLAVKYVTLLYQGWNFISIPKNSSFETAEDLASVIENCTHVGMWNTSKSSFDMHKKGASENNFKIIHSVGYLVYVNSTSNLISAGRAAYNEVIHLETGWNSIGWNNSTKTKAENLCQSISNCTAVAYWNSTLGRFIVHPVGTNISNFDVEMGGGYFVYVTTSSTWKY